MEKEAMFRDSGGALTQQPSLDCGLDGPYPSAAGKLEQVRGELGTSLGKTVLQRMFKYSRVHSMVIPLKQSTIDHISSVPRHSDILTQHNI